MSTLIKDCTFNNKVNSTIRERVALRIYNLQFKDYQCDRDLYRTCKNSLLDSKQTTCVNQQLLNETLRTKNTA